MIFILLLFVSISMSIVGAEASLNDQEKETLERWAQYTRHDLSQWVNHFSFAPYRNNAGMHAFIADCRRRLDIFRESKMHAAVQEGRFDILKLLLKDGAHPDVQIFPDNGGLDVE